MNKFKQQQIKHDAENIPNVNSFVFVQPQHGVQYIS